MRRISLPHLSISQPHVLQVLPPYKNSLIFVGLRIAGISLLHLGHTALLKLSPILPFLYMELTTINMIPKKDNKIIPINIANIT